MAVSTQILAAGPGWRVLDAVCDHGPHDRSFVEQHAETVVSAVTQGSFQYRTQAGSALLVPGALMLGNAGSAFECGHEYAGGDRCLAFHFTPAFFEGIAVGVPGVHRAAFDCASVPPVSDLIGLLANAEAARDRPDGVTLEELATRLAGAVLAITADKPAPARRPSARDERRITTAVRRIEAQANEGLGLNELGLNELGLNELAGVAAMSPYHFLRIFRQVTGMTPHQYVLHTRLHRAAARLRASADPISAIAFKAGFNDLSTFNRRFRRLIGATPTVYRATA